LVGDPTKICSLCAKGEKFVVKALYFGLGLGKDHTKGFLVGAAPRLGIGKGFDEFLASFAGLSVESAQLGAVLARRWQGVVACLRAIGVNVTPRYGLTALFADGFVHTT
jgi:hypothetical protein